MFNLLPFAFLHIVCIKVDPEKNSETWDNLSEEQLELYNQKNTYLNFTLDR